MIIKYDKSKIYDPKAFKNQVRRASQCVMDRRYVQKSLTSRATRLLFCIPGTKQLMKLIIKSGTKLIKNFESKVALTSKEDLKCHYHIQ